VLLREQVLALTVAEVGHVHFGRHDEVEVVLREVDGQRVAATCGLPHAALAHLRGAHVAVRLVALVYELHLQDGSLLRHLQSIGHGHLVACHVPHADHDAMVAARLPGPTRHQLHHRELGPEALRVGDVLVVPSGVR